MHALTTSSPAQSRRRLPPDRNGRSRDFYLAGHRIHVHTGEYEDGSIGELFIDMDQAGSTMSGLLDNFATAVSIGLQYGVPLSVLIEKFTGTAFEPAGITEGRHVTSVLDLIFSWLRDNY